MTSLLSPRRDAPCEDSPASAEQVIDTPHCLFEKARGHCCSCLWTILDICQSLMLTSLPFVSAADDTAVAVAAEEHKWSFRIQQSWAASGRNKCIISLMVISLLTAVSWVLWTLATVLLLLVPVCVINLLGNSSGSSNPSLHRRQNTLKLLFDCVIVSFVVYLLLCRQLGVESVSVGEACTALWMSGVLSVFVSPYSREARAKEMAASKARGVVASSGSSSHALSIQEAQGNEGSMKAGSPSEGNMVAFREFGNIDIGVSSKTIPTLLDMTAQEAVANRPQQMARSPKRASSDDQSLQSAHKLVMQHRQGSKAMSAPRTPVLGRNLVEIREMVNNSVRRSISCDSQTFDTLVQMYEKMNCDYLDTDGAAAAGATSRGGSHASEAAAQPATSAERQNGLEVSQNQKPSSTGSSFVADKTDLSRKSVPSSQRPSPSSLQSVSQEVQGVLKLANFLLSYEAAHATHGYDSVKFDEEQT